MGGWLEHGTPSASHGRHCKHAYIAVIHTPTTDRHTQAADGCPGESCGSMQHTHTHTASAGPQTVIIHHSMSGTAQQPKGPDVCNPPKLPTPPTLSLQPAAACTTHTFTHTHTHTTKYMLHSVEVRSQNTGRQVTVSTGAERKQKGLRLHESVTPAQTHHTNQPPAAQPRKSTAAQHSMNHELSPTLTCRLHVWVQCSR